MERKAKKGKHTGFYSLGSYTFMAELRTHSTLKKMSSWFIYPIRRVLSFSSLTKVGLKYQKPNLICICPFGLLFLLFLASSWFHDGVEKTIKMYFASSGIKGFCNHLFPSQPWVLLVTWTFRPSGPTISWLVSPWGGHSLLLAPSHSKRKHLWHLGEVLGWLRASSQCQGLEYSKCN